MSIDHNPKVFISYSWTDDKYKDRVLQIATWLVKHGVDVILDQWDLDYGQDMDSFMEMSIRKADKVLIMCDSAYRDKADKRVGGVGTETLIITPEVYGNFNQNKFIPVVMELPAALPHYIKKRRAVFLTTDNEEDYRTLLHAIFGIGKKRPELRPVDNNWLTGDPQVSSTTKVSPNNEISKDQTDHQKIFDEIDEALEIIDEAIKTGDFTDLSNRIRKTMP